MGESGERRTHERLVDDGVYDGARVVRQRDGVEDRPAMREHVWGGYWWLESAPRWGDEIGRRDLDEGQERARLDVREHSGDREELLEDARRRRRPVVEHDEHCARLADGVSAQAKRGER